ncbi:MAG: ribosome maturation factor RimM [Candidatus Comchoanobacterales bacterium]
MPENKTINSDKRIIVGQINRIFGINDWHIVTSFTQIPDQLFFYSLELKSGISIGVLEFRPHQKKFVARFDVIPDLKSSQLVNQQLFTRTSELPILNEGQYYYHQLIGFNVLNHNQNLIGKVTHIYEHCGSDILIINQGKKESHLPFSHELVIVKLEEQTILLTTEANAYL